MNSVERWIETLPFPLKWLIFIMKNIDNFLSKHGSFQSFLLFFLYNYDYILVIIFALIIMVIWYDMKYRGTLKVYDYIFQALEGIRENKIRAFFSIFGLSIGIASVIGILGIGQTSRGITYYERENNQDVSYVFSLLSPREISKRGGSREEIEKVHFHSLIKLDNQDIINIREKCNYIKKVNCYIDLEREKIEFNNKISEAYFSGFFEIPDSNNFLIAGRFFTLDEIENSRKVCLITEDLKEELFGNIDPVDKYIKMRDTLFSVKGVINKLHDKWRVYIPYSLLKDEISEKGFDFITIQTTTGCDPSSVMKEISDIIRKRHNLKFFALEMSENLDVRKSFQEKLQEKVSLTPIQAIMGVIASISLIIGGLGIMNIMLVSVTQRTREIGVRRAMGASKSDILSQFLLESIFLSIIGGFIGLILGILGTIGIVNILNKFGYPVIFMLNYFSIRNNLLLAMLFSMAVGVLFGEYPARKASQMDPIDCLRHS
ncbi:MAG TPA: ABC transporter permease [Candidatus Eremiobacteraeota bacterium]|mgnify:CR=1 FL=1|nr:ABC transporter permease [Candidatus Eremiobacteraeota bacterium]